MQISYDKEADAVAIWLKDVESKKTIDIAEDIFIDVDKDGRFAGLEILHASENIDLSDLLDIPVSPPDSQSIMKSIPYTSTSKLDSNFYLYVITDHDLSRGRPDEEVVEQAMAGGADVIQLRDKGRTTKELLQEALRLREITREKGVKFIINDRVDLALASDADGVHLGQDDLPIKWARKLLGDGKIIGASAQTVEQAVQAEKDSADYVAVSAIFSTPTKPDAQALGLEAITNIKRNVNIPVVAIGGIKEENAAQVREAGADCIAVISAVVSADNIEEAARNLRKKFLAAKQTGGES